MSNYTKINTNDTISFVETVSFVLSICNYEIVSV